MQFLRTKFLFLGLLCFSMQSYGMQLLDTYNRFQALLTNCISMSHNIHLMRPGYQLSLQQHPNESATTQQLVYYTEDAGKHELASEHVASQVRAVFAKYGIVHSHEHPLYVVKMKYEPWKRTSLGIKVTNHYVFIDEANSLLNFANPSDVLTHYLIAYAALEYKSSSFLKRHAVSIGYYATYGFLQYKFSGYVRGLVVQGLTQLCPSLMQQSEDSESFLRSSARFTGNMALFIGTATVVSNVLGLVDRPVRSFTTNIYDDSLMSGLLDTKHQDVMDAINARGGAVMLALKPEQMALLKHHLQLLQDRVGSASAS